MEVSPVAQHHFGGPGQHDYHQANSWGGYVKDSHDVQVSPTCRFSHPNYGLEKADADHTAAVVMNKSRTCKTSELYPVTSTVVVCPSVIAPQNFTGHGQLRGSLDK